MKQKTKREEFCFSFLTWVYAAFPETYAFAPTRKPIQAVEAMHPTISPSTVCISGIYFVWKRIYLIGSILLECQRSVFAGSLVALFCEWIFSPGAYLHVSPGLHSRAGHTGPHSPSQCASHVSLVCQPVSGVLQCQLSVSTVSRSPELSETETDCWVIFPSSPGSQWMPDSQNR